MMPSCVASWFKKTKLYTDEGRLNPCRGCQPVQPKKRREDDFEEYVPLGNSDSSDEDDEDDDIGEPEPESVKLGVRGKNENEIPAWAHLTGQKIFDIMAFSRLNKKDSKPVWIQELKPTWGVIVKSLLRELRGQGLIPNNVVTIAKTKKERIAQRGIFQSCFDGTGNEDKLNVLRTLISKATVKEKPAEAEAYDDLLARLAMLCVQPRCQATLAIVMGGLQTNETR